jgi:hypothetical protein
MAGDAGLIMCSWPKGGKNAAFKNHWQYGYFNECMTGFEYQAAAHMVWEGIDNSDLLEHGLAVTRAIHDRYNAALRNPYNEIECSDHYSRAMASFGVFQAACGFNCHGPRGHLEFAPRLSPEKFRAPFTSAEGWGSFEQTVADGRHACRIEWKFGTLRLRTLGLAALPSNTLHVVARVDGRPETGTVEIDEGRVAIRFAREILLKPGETLELELRNA